MHDNSADNIQVHKKLIKIKREEPGTRIVFAGSIRQDLKPLLAVLGIRIRMFLGLPDSGPDPLVRGTDPDPATDPSLFS